MVIFVSPKKMKIEQEPYNPWKKDSRTDDPPLLP